MGDLISRSALIFAIKNEYDVDYGEQLINPKVFVEMAEDASTIEAKPVVHGEWIKVSPYRYACSKCEYNVQITEADNFCPHCGADMRKPELIIPADKMIEFLEKAGGMND